MRLDKLPVLWYNVSMDAYVSRLNMPELPEVEPESEEAQALSDRLQRGAMTPGEVLARLTAYARAPHADYVNEDGVDLEALVADGYGFMVKNISRTRFGYKVEFHNSLSALQLLGRYYGLFNPRPTEEEEEEALRIIVEGL